MTVVPKSVQWEVNDDSNRIDFLLESSYINNNTIWKQHGITIAGENDKGNKLNQLYYPCGIYVDDDNQCIYIADRENHRIVKWKYDAKNGEVVAGGNGQGNRMDQLNRPTDVIVNKKSDDLIICDYGNKRVIRCSSRNDKNQQTIISDINCWGLAMDNNGDLYVSDWVKDEVRRWKIGDKRGIIVAGGNGKGNKLNQLISPRYIFVDRDYSIYISDNTNHRVMKWMKGAKDGVVVAGGQGQGDRLTQLAYPKGVIVDHLGNVYVADFDNYRIMRWLKGSKQGSIIVGENRRGKQSNQLKSPRGLSFDRQGNLYVVYFGNNRVEKFEIN
jgi:sugar lactone lactonase YvrE